ncbi:hypothetical protein B0H10DRAFT_2194199 [Mycena sp. CBHHK59/15]|nr:hypothetical protein B0H10DRAFT_2194199 [Mycena sp. CBHHK59/15]
MSLPQEIVDTIIDDVGDPESLGGFRGRAIKGSGGYGASRTAWSSRPGLTKLDTHRRPSQGDAEANDGELRCNPVVYMLETLNSNGEVAHTTALPVPTLPQTSETKSTDMRSNPDGVHEPWANVATEMRLNDGLHDDGIRPPTAVLRSTMPANRDRFTYFTCAPIPRGLFRCAPMMGGFDQCALTSDFGIDDGDVRRSSPSIGLLLVY